jgi:hypothetical protein
MNLFKNFSLNLMSYLGLALLFLLSGSPIAGEKASKSGGKRFRLVWTQDPATTASLIWESDSSSLGGRKLYFGESDFGQDVSKYPMVLIPEKPVPYKGMNNVTARLVNLKADQNYYLVIEEGGKLSPRFWFRTAPISSMRPLSLIAGGDSRNNKGPRRNANLLVAKLRPTAVLFGGDYTGSGTNSEWQEWLDDWQLTIPTDGRLIPIVPTRGNHESSDEILTKLFDVPVKNYYALNLGGNLLRVYTLNTESSISGDQTTWLHSDLNQNSGSHWTFAQFHRPIRPHTKSKSEGTSSYRSWAPLFYEKGVDVAIDSDSHLIKSTWPIRPATGADSVEGFSRDDEAGTVYIGEGGWGAPLRPADDNKTWTRNSASFNHFFWIFVDRQKLEIRAVDTANASEVSALTENDVFSIPAKLKVWTPSNGSVIRLNRNTSAPRLSAR